MQKTPKRTKTIWIDVPKKTTWPFTRALGVAGIASRRSLLKEHTPISRKNVPTTKKRLLEGESLKLKGFFQPIWPWVALFVGN